ncbi:MAG: tol-pal system YbgF family protein [Fidelibacterota bacterium]
MPVNQTFRPDSLFKTLLGLLLISVLSAQTESTSLSEIFFLDLGIVIEPVKGNETYSRLVEKPSQEVTFRVKKVNSGSVYMASSKEMLAALERINQRIEILERSFTAEMNTIKHENRELRQSIAELRSDQVEEIKPLQLAEKVEPPVIIDQENPEELPDEEIQELPPASNPMPIFNQSRYMAGVFAYQREDYRVALEKFYQLDLAAANPKTAENVLYWMADSHARLGEIQKALEILDQVVETGSQRNDDALIQKGLIYRRLGKESMALAAFTDVVNHYPQSEYVRLAQIELRKAETAP